MKKFKLSSFVPKESDEQIVVVDYCKAMAPRTPELDLIYAIPNGVPLNGAQRFAVVNQMKRMGMKPGMLDLGLPVARGGYHGLFLEMKRTKGAVIGTLQEWWMRRLREEGYQVAVAEGADQAIQILETYLSQK